MGCVVKVKLEFPTLDGQHFYVRPKVSPNCEDSPLGTNLGAASKSKSERKALA
jgi:hypothetical protein